MAQRKESVRVRIASLSGRLTLVSEPGGIDVGTMANRLVAPPA
jgi:hypothetical protein